MKVENLIIAIFLIVVAILILDGFKWYYYISQLISELEWVGALLWIGSEYSKRPKKNYITIVFGCLCFIEILSLIRAIWVTVYYLRHIPRTPIELEAVDTAIYNHSHDLHLCGYWLAMWAMFVMASIYYLCRITLPKKQ